MQDIRAVWKEMWNERAKSDDMFIQIGRSSYTPLDFFLMIKDITHALDFNKKDILLDAGGGAGWVAAALSPFVERIVLFDFAEGMVEKAKELTKGFGNIDVYHDDLLVMDTVKNIKFTKAMAGSVIQLLEDYNQIETAFSNIYHVLKKGGKAFFTHNPDIRKKVDHIQSYSRLNWDNERLEKALELEEKRLWLDADRLGDVCRKIGFSASREAPINPKLWQSTHMFDYMVVK